MSSSWTARWAHAFNSLVLTADDYGGPELEGCLEYLNITRPDAIAGIHRSYLDAGADIIETNTFGSTPLVLGEYGQADRAEEISRIGAELARAAADDAATPEHPDSSRAPWAPQHAPSLLRPTSRSMSWLSITGFRRGA